MHLDFKITTWERAIVEKEDQEIVLKAIKDGKLKTQGEFDNLDIEALSWETMTDVSEYMLPSENDSRSTVEVYDDNDKKIYVNGID